MGTSENRCVDEKGRVTLPQSIRESLGIEAGEEVTVELDDGRVLIRPRVSREEFVAEMAGCIDAKARAESAEPTDPRELKDDWTGDL